MPTRHRIPLRLRRQVIARANQRCEYCKAPESFSLDTFAVDHIQPVSHDGDNALDNLAFACNNCNNRKFDATTAIDPEARQRVPLYHPRLHLWSEHFAWSEDALMILPLTATGRATMARLQLNRLGAINVRRGLIALGEEHPPLG